MMTLSAKSALHRGARVRSRRGVSLVEVLVVLVVLIVGFAAMARLFPEGFASLGFTANATQAQAWMKFNEDRLRQARENLPDAVVGIDPNTGLIRASLSPQDYLTAFRQYPIPGYTGTPPDDPRFSDVNQARRVIGEHLQIPPATIFAPTGEMVSLYRPLFGPIYSDAAMAPASVGLAAYSGTPLRRVVFEDPPTEANWSDLAELGDFGYGIDYDQARLYFYSSPNVRLFRIEFRYHGGPGVEAEGVQDNCFYLEPDNSAPQRITFDLRAAQAPMYNCNYVPLPVGGTLYRGTDFVYRRFMQLPIDGTFSDDPYEFKVYDGVFGLLGFNPRAATTPLPLQQGRGLSAQIDYDVDDWHILHDDTNVTLVPIDPDGSPDSGDEAYVIKLAASAIKKIGDTEETINFLPNQPADTNTFEYQGLQRYYPDNPSRTGTPGIDLVIVDLETGLQIDSRTLQKDGDNTHGEIDYRAGVIHLWKYQGRNAGSGPIVWSPPYSLQGGGGGMALDPAGRRVRVYFRTESDLAVATFKPYNRYYLQTNLNALREREYLPYNYFSGGSSYGYLLFPPMDGEKTVAVDYQYLWQDPANPGDPSLYQLRNVVGEMHQIAAPGTAAAPTLTPPYHTLWWVRVAHGDADPSKGAVGGDTGFDPDVVPGSVVIIGVRGASLHTHVVWRDSGRYRHRQRATLLTRQESR